MALKFNPLEGGRTVKAEILAFVLPVVIIGLLVLAGVIFKFTGSAFEEQLESRQTASPTGSMPACWKPR